LDGQAQIYEYSKLFEDYTPPPPPPPPSPNSSYEYHPWCSNITDPFWGLRVKKLDVATLTIDLSAVCLVCCLYVFVVVGVAVVCFYIFFFVSFLIVLFFSFMMTIQTPIIKHNQNLLIFILRLVLLFGSLVEQSMQFVSCFRKRQQYNR
jgi:hypothetical protein